MEYLSYFVNMQEPAKYHFLPEQEGFMVNSSLQSNVKATFAKRLSQARNINGLSLRELSKLLKNTISYNALHKYEQGEMIPGTKTLNSLSDVLNEPPDFFFRPFKISLAGIEFRKRSSIKIKQIKAIKEKAAVFFERYLEIEEILNIAGNFKNPIEGNNIRSSRDIEDAAYSLRKAWNIGAGPFPCVTSLLEEKHIKVYEVDGDDKFDGFSGWAGNIPVIVLNKNYAPDRKRLTALHELGHLILNLPDNLTGKEKEIKCFEFAGALLLPEKAAKAELGKKRTRITVEELLDIKKRYGISCQAIMKRAEKLEIFNSSQMRRFWIIWSQNGYRKDEPGTSDLCLPEKTERFDQLVLRGVAEELISETKGAELIDEPLSDFRKRLKVLP